MSKNELRMIARIMLIGTGLYMLLQALLNFLGSIAIMQFIESAKIQVPLLIAAVAIYAVILLMGGYFLFRCENFFSTKIVESDSIDNSQISWLAVAFRLICVIAGVLFLFWTVPNLIVTVLSYIMNMNNKSGQQHIYIGMSSITDIAKYIVLLAISIYLACGAPGFVRWQVRRTLRQCSKIEEQLPTGH
ncbi:MAG: hypothetical protein ABSG82_07835 [Sedimentisphaerales bacterium]|jgi:hypothetical protein